MCVRACARFILSNFALIPPPPQSSTSQGPIFLPDPHDGSLHVIDPSTGALLRSSLNVRDIVNLTPFTGSDGNVYNGKKDTRVLAVDANTGATLGDYQHEDVDVNPDYGSWSATPAVVMIGRTSYSLTIRNLSSNEVRLNLTLAEFSNPGLRTSAETPERWQVFEPGMGMVAIDDVLVYGSEADGWLWSLDMGSRLVGLYVADSSGSLRQVPLDRLHVVPPAIGDDDEEEDGAPATSMLIPQGDSLMQVGGGVGDRREQGAGASGAAAWSCCGPANKRSNLPPAGLEYGRRAVVRHARFRHGPLCHEAQRLRRQHHQGGALLSLLVLPRGQFLPFFN